MRHCIDGGIQLSPDDTRAGPPHVPQEGATSRVDGKLMNLLAVLEGRPDGSESWGGCWRLGKGRRCSLAFGLVIMTLVMASYILSGARQELLLASPFRYRAFPGSPSPPDGEIPSDAQEPHPQPPAGNLSSARDAPGLRSVIDSIAARVTFTARQLPGTDDLRRQEPHVSSSR
ncbi:carbohydrate sulfotransferase 15 [Myotis lucifugus]|uniref:carbohydrate sulfotransferase 15 n=1 Tax=Myotis lucifugus TaxID=59463 RepID=UPI0006D70B67|nr:carbohydrate sulfotransferase 15 [Myotis lucifugus]